MKKISQKNNDLIRTIVTLLIMVMLFVSITKTALIAEPIVPNVAVSEIVFPEVAVSEVSSQASSENGGYTVYYTDSFSGSFPINVTGSVSGKTKIEAWDFGDSNVDVYVTLYRPDGSIAFSDVRLPIGIEISKSFNNLQLGTYTLSYTVSSDTYKGWIYCNIS